MTLVPTYAALLAILFVFLSYKVGQARKKEKVLIGTGGSSIVERAMRVQANFAEYTPITLLLLAFLEMKEANIYFLHFLCLSFSIGRVIHAYGFSQQNENLRYTPKPQNPLAIKNLSVLLYRKIYLYYINNYNQL